jgi:hypothetical protein
MIHDIAALVYKRSVDFNRDEPEIQLPAWSWAVVLANLVVFLPVIVFTSYTLKHIYPTLAIIEDENPPAYDPVPTYDPSADAANAAESNNHATGVTDGKPRPVTASLRSTSRALASTGGWFRSSFRGLTCLLVQFLATNFLVGIFSAFFPRLLASLAALLASLALVQLSSAWVHIVISPPSHLHFYHRLPSFKRAFDATARPVAVYWLAQEVATVIPMVMAWGLHLYIPNFTHGGHPAVPNWQHHDVLKALAVLVVSVACRFLFVLPAFVVLVRVQASLLPGEVDTIVPFDRSFEGKVEPAVVDGKGYVTMRDAWATFSRAAWKRLVILYAKIYLVSIAITALMMAIIAPQVALMISKGVRKEPL